VRIQEEMKELVLLEDFKVSEFKKHEKFLHVNDQIENLDKRLEAGIAVIYRYDEVISDKASKLTVELLEKRLLE